MKNRLRVLYSVVAAMSILFGSVLTVSAEETDLQIVNNSNELFYEEQEADENGNYNYIICYEIYQNIDANIRNNFSYNIVSPYKLAVMKNITGETVTYSVYGLKNNVADFVFTGLSGQLITTYIDNGEVGSTTTSQVTGLGNVAYQNQQWIFYNSNIPIFSDKVSVDNYLLNGVIDEVENKKPFYASDSDLYLKNIRWNTQAITTEGGKENEICYMFWDTDNLTENDFINIKADLWYQHYILGKKVSGAYDLIEMKKQDDFSSVSWSSAYGYGLDLQEGSLYFNYLTFPMLYANSIEEINNIYNGGVDSLYLQLVRYVPETNTYVQGLWVKVNFKDSLVSYADVDSIQGGMIDAETGEFHVNPDTEYGVNGYGINGETGHIVTSNNLGSMDSIDEMGEFAFAKMKGLASQLGQFPSLIYNVFSFLPVEIMVFIGAGIVIVIVLRIIGR